ncbi:MAG: PAS-domain containing protein [Burkholderiales bacterium]|nr:PAS-domain containing protein [Burkholderiales bacterium]
MKTSASPAAAPPQSPPTCQAGPAGARPGPALVAERVRLYRGGKWSAILGQTIMAALVLWVVHGQVPAAAAWAWAAVVAASLAARAFCDAGRGEPAAELRRTRAAVLAMGVAFGLTSVLVFPAAHYQSQVFLAFMIAGLAAGSLTLTSFDLRVALAYALIVLAPLVVRLVAGGEPQAMGVGAAAGMFVVFLAMNGLRAQRNMRETVAVREADARRTESLMESQRRLEHTTAELKRASEELRLTFEHMDQGIFSLGPDGRTTFFNRRMCELTGLPESFMATRPTGVEITRYQYEHGHFGDEQKLLEAGIRDRLRQWLAGVPVPLPAQYFRRTHLGTVLDVKTAPLPGGGFVRTFDDVTALVDTNTRLQHSEAQARKLALVASHTDDAVLITDPERRIEWVNESFTRLTGYTLAEAAGRRTSEFLRGPQTDSDTVARIDEALRLGMKGAGEILHYRKDGSAYWFALETRAVPGEDGRVLHYIGIGRDVTARRESEQALRAARDEAERASRAKSEFLSSMSHELRTPMNAILGFAQLLEGDRREPLSARQREQVRQIREAGAHLLELINDVLDLARVEAGREVIVIEPVALAPLVDECLVLMRPLAEERGIDVAAELPALLPRASADRMRLKQVLLNLLANAIKYNQPRGRVRVRAAATAGRLDLTVADTGPGLDAQARERLFTAFERLGAEHGPVEGAGIGLALSRRLLALMQGTIEVASEPGRGSTFTVSLPAEEDALDGAAQPAAALDAEAAAPPQAPETVWPPAAGNTVLYIEDNTVNVVLMQSMLESVPGLRLLVAERPEPGLELAWQNRPDLILLDIQLPGIDGYEVLRRLRADDRTRHTPVIAISANAMRGDIERGLAAGFDDYLTKPLDVAALRAMVRQRLQAVGS